MNFLSDLRRALRPQRCGTFLLLCGLLLCEGLLLRRVLDALHSVREIHNLLNRIGEIGLRCVMAEEAGIQAFLIDRACFGIKRAIIPVVITRTASEIPDRPITAFFTNMNRRHRFTFGIVTIRIRNSVTFGIFQCVITLNHHHRTNRKIIEETHGLEAS
jgi:hypothetical protein